MPLVGYPCQLYYCLLANDIKLFEACNSPRGSVCACMCNIVKMSKNASFCLSAAITIIIYTILELLPAIVYWFIFSIIPTVATACMSMTSDFVSMVIVPKTPYIIPAYLALVVIVIVLDVTTEDLLSLLIRIRTHAVQSIVQAIITYVDITLKQRFKPYRLICQFYDLWKHCRNTLCNWLPSNSDQLNCWITVDSQCVDFPMDANGKLNSDIPVVSTKTTKSMPNVSEWDFVENAIDDMVEHVIEKCVNDDEWQYVDGKNINEFTFNAESHAFRTSISARQVLCV